MLVRDGEVFRFFAGRGAAAFAALRASGLLERLVQCGWLMPHELVPAPHVAELSEALPADATLVRHPALPFVSYVYEWPFSMLKAAALLHLDVLWASLEAGFILKDASTYNVQFVGPRPVFIDLGSFSPHGDGQPWQAYTQFCRMFLNPLLLHALAATPYQRWMRSSLEGIAPGELSPLLKLRHKLRPSVLTNVVLQAFLERRFASATPGEVGVTPHVPRRALLRQVEKLRRTIEGLEPASGRSRWSTYEETNSYSEEARRQKGELVESVLAEAHPAVVWDLGSNRGEYALLACRYAQTVVAMDEDADVVGLLFQRVRDAQPNLLPLVMDVLNPSPDQGWGQQERQGLKARGKADVVLALALLHHLRIGGNVPVAAFVSWLASVARQGVLEFVPKSDPMVKRLLAWRADIYDDYTPSNLESALGEHFRITRTVQLAGSERVLYAFTER